MQNCFVCAKKNLWQSSPWWEWENGQYTSRWWQCRNCTHWQKELPPQGLRIAPKVLYLDIETAMMKVYAYDLFVPSKRISKDMIAENSFVICWSAAWLDAENKPKRIMSDVCTTAEAKKHNDKRIVERIYTLIDEADVIIGHNSDGFDLKILNWRFLLAGLPFPADWKKKVDTYKLSVRYTRPPSRGLEYLSVALGGKPKQGLTRDEWIAIVETGDAKLLAKADKYCRGDVKEGVKVFREYANAIEVNGKRLYR